MPGDFGVSTVDDRLRAIAHAGGNEGFDALLAFLGDYRAHLYALVKPEADLDGGSGVGYGIAEGSLRFADRHGNGNAKATLPGAAERGITDDLAREIHVGVRQYDYVVLSTALALHALSGSGGALVNMFGNGRGANEADGTNGGGIAECV